MKPERLLKDFSLSKAQWGALGIVNMAQIGRCNDGGAHKRRHGEELQSADQGVHRTFIEQEAHVSKKFTARF
jgi:hypothetical protein